MRNNRGAFFLLAALFILLCASSLVLAIPYEKKVYTLTQPIVDPKPFIKVNFGENPVTIAQNEYGLYTGVLTARPATGGFDVACTATTDTSAASTNYTFMLSNADSYLLNGPYTFYAYARDADGNAKEVFVTFTIKAPVPDVCLVAPLHDSQTLLQCGRFGMASTRTFDLSFRINSEDIPAKDCKLDFVDYLPPGITSVNTDPSILYSSFRTLINTTGGQPAFEFTVRNFSDLKNLNIPSGRFTRIMVVCKDQNGAFSLSQPPLEIGWDDSAPVFTATTPKFSPATISDPSYKTSTLSVTTDDDTFCVYSNTIYPPAIGRYILPLGAAATKRSDYNASKRVAFSFNSISPQAHGFTPYPFAFKVNCTNAAGLSKAANATVTVKFDSAIVITKKSPPAAVKSTTVLFNFTTNVYANCQLSLNNTAKANSSGLIHSKTLALTQGSHDYRIDCTQLMYPAASLSGKVTLDTVPPVAPNITEWTKVLCGNERMFEAIIRTTDKTVDIYNYTIVRKQGNFSLQGEVDRKGDATSLKLLLGKLVAGSTYTLSVKAIDQAGNQGVAKAVDFTTKPAGDISCDTLSPQTAAVLEGKPSLRRGYNITISCKDESGGSGCQAQGRYSLIALGAACPANTSSYTVSFPVNKTTLMPSNKTVCWVVTDKAMNEAKGKKDLPLPTATELCGNKEVEPGEICDTATTLTCSTLGFTGGNLSCAACKLSTAKCLGVTGGVCGDNVTNVGENCDGASLIACRTLMPYYPEGKLSCVKCSLDTSSCRAGATLPPSPPPSNNATCTPACGIGKTCRAGVCVVAASTNTTPPAVCAPPCGTGKVCTLGVCKDVIYPEPPAKSNAFGILLLVIGLLSLLGGVGYLVYAAYFPPYSPTQSFSSSMPLPPQPAVSPEEAERRRAIDLAKMKERLALQEQAHQKTMQEKDRHRKDIINSFKEDHFVKKGERPARPVVTPTVPPKVSVEKEKPTVTDHEKKASVKPKAAAKGDEGIADLEGIADDDGKTDPFEHLATLTGASKTRVKNAFSKDEVTGKDVAGLFKDKERVTAKDVTPTLRRALDEEFIDEEAAQDTLDSLQDNEKLSEGQKKKILKDLELIGKE